MRRVLITCPQTGHAVFTGVQMDEAAFQRADLTDQTLKACASCGQTHVWSKADARLE
jgi:uncharacterized protein YjbI with pentapeptide repeats